MIISPFSEVQIPRLGKYDNTRSRRILQRDPTIKIQKGKKTGRESLTRSDRSVISWQQLQPHPFASSHGRRNRHGANAEKEGEDYFQSMDRSISQVSGPYDDEAHSFDSLSSSHSVLVGPKRSGPTKYRGFPIPSCVSPKQAPDRMALRVPDPWEDDPS